MHPHHYENDYYAWLKETASLLRGGKFAQVDAEHVAEELEGMSKSQKHQLLHRLVLLIFHLLKWEFQPERRSASWQITIRNQRLDIRDLLEESPSLKHELSSLLEKAWRHALGNAALETGIPSEDFPRINPYPFAQLIDDHFFPGE